MLSQIVTPIWHYYTTHIFKNRFGPQSQTLFKQSQHWCNHQLVSVETKLTQYPRRKNVLLSITSMLKHQSFVSNTINTAWEWVIEWFQLSGGNSLAHFFFQMFHLPKRPLRLYCVLSLIPKGQHSTLTEETQLIANFLHASFAIMFCGHWPTEAISIIKVKIYIPRRLLYGMT